MRYTAKVVHRGSTMPAIHADTVTGCLDAIRQWMKDSNNPLATVIVTDECWPITFTAIVRRNGVTVESALNTETRG